MDSDANPYRPPDAPVELAQPPGEQRPLAGKGRRFATVLLDTVGIFVCGALLGILLVHVLGTESLAFLRGTWPWRWLVQVFAYYLFFEGVFGRIPGKMMLGTVVTDLDGNPPTAGAVLKRTLARYVPLEALTFLINVGFHDSISRTKVVRRR